MFLVFFFFCHSGHELARAFHFPHWSFPITPFYFQCSTSFFLASSFPLSADTGMASTTFALPYRFLYSPDGRILASSFLIPFHNIEFSFFFSAPSGRWFLKQPKEPRAKNFLPLSPFWLLNLPVTLVQELFFQPMPVSPFISIFAEKAFPPRRFHEFPVFWINPWPPAFFV